MKIRKLMIHNYGHLRDVVLDNLGDIVILAGPDKSEKSDLIDAIDLFFKGLDVAEQVEVPPIESMWISNIMDVPIEFAFVFELDKAELALMLPPELADEMELQKTNVLEISRTLVKNATSAKWHTQDVRLNHVHLIKARKSASESEASELAQTILEVISENLANKFKLARPPRSRQIQEPEGIAKHMPYLRVEILNKLEKLSLVSDTPENYKKKDIEETARILCAELSDMQFKYENLPRITELSKQEENNANSQPQDGLTKLVNFYCQILREEEDAILAVEEPEIHLHTDKTKQIIPVLKNLGYHHQIFLISHSSILIDEAGFHDVWILRKDKNQTRAHKMKESRELNTLLEELHLRASDILTARGLIFVETRTERKALPAWAAKLGIDFHKLGFSVIPIYAKATSRYHFPIWISAAEQIGIPYYFVLNRSAVEQSGTRKIFKEKLLLRKNLYFFSKASIEEYFPDNKIVEALEKVYDIKIPMGERKIPSPKAASIEKLIISRKKNPAGWNILLGDVIAESMSINEIDSEITNILLGIKKDYMEVMNSQ